jgi:hypothetical protein
MFGLKINFENCEVLMVLKDDDKGQEYAQLYNF